MEKGQENFLLASLFFLFWEKHSDNFLIWEHISQIKKIFLNKFEGSEVWGSLRLVGLYNKQFENNSDIIIMFDM